MIKGSMLMNILRIRYWVAISFLTLLNGCATYSPVDLTYLTDSAENSRYAAVRVYKPGDEPTDGYETLGKVDSYICNRSGNTPATPEAATNLIRSKASRAGATGVINYQCKQSPTSFNENCWGSIRCSGYAIRNIESASYSPSEQESPPKSGGGNIGLGTCFAVSPDGYLVTNHHVIKDATQVFVRMSDNNIFPAKVVTSTASTDLAILKIDANRIPYLSLASSRSVRLGEKVFTIGYPLAQMLGTDPKYTEGVVSAKSGLSNEPITYQITVPVQPGNSGGPLVNLQGEVVGVITSTASSIAFFKESGNMPQNINWAVKSDYVNPLLENIPNKVVSKGRQEAIAKTEQAICMVLTSN